MNSSFGGGIMFLGLACAAGVLMAIQGGINGAVGKVLGTLEGNFLVHAVGLLILLLLLFGLRLGNGSLTAIQQVPWWGYLGGLLNVGIIYGVMASVTQVGMTNATTAIIVGQVGMAMLIDCLGLFGMEKLDWHWSKLIGLLLLAIGGKIMLGK